MTGLLAVRLRGVGFVKQPKKRGEPPQWTALVAHNRRDQFGRRRGHLAIVQRRSDAALQQHGGERFASWAQPLREGEAFGAPERFETYRTFDAAARHAAYAARREA